ncbi:MAG: 30S ribosomal protein S16 [Candidatus Omnitrophota bacterium]|nr:30S ribosomal protein S16 [Candidatus Omnitrophota bacterium]MBU1929198.1 30S ribosomal protein S16 [Candidatus Omnitrophota bacterium]MBU2035489.1 30S ribosomal protein S16 [Candidatus Omnitrophota bacterium]MBU2257841.1 30S ribosomal protein S16 [Candidatus Omnitrophota bacterium]
MSARIRLRRIGKNPKKKPHFRVSVFDSKRNRDSKFIEEIGFYNPITGVAKIKKDRYDFWVSKGAQASETIKRLVKKQVAV